MITSLSDILIVVALVWSALGVVFVKYIRDPEGLLESILWIFIAGPISWVLAFWFGIGKPILKKLCK